MARKEFTGRVCWSELSRSVMVARVGEVIRFGEKKALRSRLLA